MPLLGEIRKDPLILLSNVSKLPDKCMVNRHLFVIFCLPQNLGNTVYYGLITL